MKQQLVHAELVQCGKYVELDQCGSILIMVSEVTDLDFDYREFIMSSMRGKCELMVNA